MTILQESIAQKAKEFVVNNKGKLAALAAGAAAVGGTAYAHNHGYLGDVERGLANAADKIGLDNVAEKLRDDAKDQYLTAFKERRDFDALKNYGEMKVEDAKHTIQNITNTVSHKIHDITNTAQDYFNKFATGFKHGEQDVNPDAHEA